MDRWSGKVAVITGSSSGIGECLAKYLLKYNIKVVGLARRLERLKTIAKEVTDLPGTFYPLKADITNEEEVVKAFEWIENNLSGVDILINNAGICRNTTLSNGDTKLWKEVFDTNVLGLCVASREAVKLMKEKHIEEGHIIHINSLLGHSIPSSLAVCSNVYGASKHAVTALTESLRVELAMQKLPIKVTSISPGLVRTEIHVSGGIDTSLVDLEKMPILEPESVAEAIISVLSTSVKCNITEITIQSLWEMY